MENTQQESQYSAIHSGNTAEFRALKENEISFVYLMVMRQERI